MPKDDLPRHPKLDVCRYVFSRPTNGGAFSEYVKEYLKRLQEEDIKSPERSLLSQAEIAMAELAKEEKDRNS